MELIKLIILIMFSGIVKASIHPISIQGRYFIDSVTKDPFFIKGVDYQPGGSSGVSVDRDPLSDPNTCARDIILFQELGINTIRVYSVNPDLNHDKCMTMLANAGIYLVLDVNSPLPNENLNRYEPWTSYNEFYLEHILKVVEQFSWYPNTLLFFAGNEVVNDRRSLKLSSTYVKAVVRDLKNYISLQSPRFIPVGYSAADDLLYRVSFAKYLECEEEDKLSVDFYGVNSYQWCGEQSFHSSGYDKLVDDYMDYTKPIFLSEFGCNEVQPRIFQEVGTLYSKEMTTVFSGGLVYEFSQELNNYGLIEYQQNGDVNILLDFNELKQQYANTPQPVVTTTSKFKPGRAKNAVQCLDSYENLGEIVQGLPMTLLDFFIQKGVSVKKGVFLNLNDNDYVTTFKIFNTDGSLLAKDSVVPIIDSFITEQESHHNKGFGIFLNGTYQLPI